MISEGNAHCKLLRERQRVTNSDRKHCQFAVYVEQQPLAADQAGAVATVVAFVGGWQACCPAGATCCVLSLAE